MEQKREELTLTLDLKVKTREWEYPLSPDSKFVRKTVLKRFFEEVKEAFQSDCDVAIGYGKETSQSIFMDDWERDWLSTVVVDNGSHNSRLRELLSLVNGSSDPETGDVFVIIFKKINTVDRAFSLRFT